MSARRYPTHLPVNTVGILLGFEFAMDFLAWAAGREPTPAQIAEAFGVSRATSYRYRAALVAFRERHPEREFARVRPQSHIPSVDESKACTCGALLR